MGTKRTHLKGSGHFIPGYFIPKHFITLWNFRGWIVRDEISSYIPKEYCCSWGLTRAGWPSLTVLQDVDNLVRRLSTAILDGAQTSNLYPRSTCCLTTSTTRTNNFRNNCVPVSLSLYLSLSLSLSLSFSPWPSVSDHPSLSLSFPQSHPLSLSLFIHPHPHLLSVSHLLSVVVLPVPGGPCINMKSGLCKDSFTAPFCPSLRAVLWYVICGEENKIITL